MLKRIIFSFALLGASFAPSMSQAETKTAIFAGGCFWCMEKDFDHVDGVLNVVSGYSGGKTDNPNYKTYENGKHIEVVQITYDSEKTDYKKLLHTFWRSVDPTDAGGQFCDRGHGYTTAIFALDEEQKSIAEQSKADLVAQNILPKPIVTPILEATEFWPAEEYHQDFYKKSPIRYKFYRASCGRDKTIRKLWGAQAHAGIMY